MPIRCALYARVSTEEQAEKFGLAAQITELREIARRKGYQFRPECEFIDDGYSGGDLDRPALTRLRELARQHLIDVALVYDPDRLARKLSHQIILAEELEQARVKLEFVTTPTDDTPEGKMFFNLKGVFAEYEKEKIRERTLRGRRQKARQGYIVGGRTPYGYRYLGKAEAERGRYILHEEEARIVRLVFRWLVEEGLSIRAIVARLNELGYRPQRGARWGKSSVHRILSNPVYAGTAYYNRRERVLPCHPRSNEPNRRDKKTALRSRPSSEWIPISVPATVDAQLFERACEQLRRNAAMSSGRNIKYFYLLRGLLRCGICGRKYVGVPGHGRRYYRCQGRDRLYGSNRCKVGLLHADRIEDFIWRTIVRILKDPDLLSKKLREHASELVTGMTDVSSEVARLERCLAEVERQEARALEAYLQESLQLPLLKSKLEELTSRKSALAGALAKAKEEEGAYKSEVSKERQIADFCRLALRGIGNLKNEGRQRLLRSVIDEIRVTGKEVEIRGILPGRFVVFGSGSTKESGCPSVIANGSEWQDAVTTGMLSSTMAVVELLLATPGV
jgi:site-specific DNA recombinase